jgi:D-sedoheptulose 7-phosphate isomerase
MNLPDMQRLIVAKIEQNIALKQSLLNDPEYIESVSAAAREMTRALNEQHKILFFGNGGSAADAQHLAAELTGRFQAERRSLPALALNCNVSSLTAVANDYGFEQVFARQIAGLGTAGDIAVGISTSGNSRNVLLAMDVAREKGIVTVGLTGRGGKLSSSVDHCIRVPSDSTPRIQEAHILTGHILCEIIEQHFMDAAFQP